jgi:tetratricopeptide (TPR) repeat protein/cold shock CspA family protein
MKVRDPRQEDRLRTARAMRERGEVQVLLARFGAIDEESSDAWEDVDLVAEVARAHSLANNTSQVERYFQRCAQLNPRRAALYLAEIGWYYQRKKRWARAILWYDHSIATFPTYHLCLFRKGYCLERLHRPRLAVEALEAAIASFEAATPEQQVRSRGIQAQVLFHVARSLREIGETDRARAALDRGAALDCGPDIVIKPEHRLASYAATHLRDGNPTAAVACLEEARQRDPRSAVIWERIGLAYAMACRLDEAEQALRHAVDLPKGAVALVSLGQFYLAQQRWTDAARALSSALERHPQGDVRIQIEMAALHRALGRPRAALALLGRLASGRVPPQSTLARTIEHQAAEVLLEYGEIDRARSHAARALAHDPMAAETLALRDRIEAAAATGSTAAPLPLVDAALPADIEGLLAPASSREAGTIASYFSARGFGFITFRDREETIFFHVSHVDPAAVPRLAVGRPVSFVVSTNARNGKAQAEEVRLEDDGGALHGGSSDA